MGNARPVGSTTTSTSIKSKMKELIPEYKALYLYWLYAPELLPPDAHIKTFEDLTGHFKMFPKGVTEEQAKVWLFEEPVQNALKVLLKSKHAQRMVELYNIYFDKAKNDTNAFKAFIDFSEKYFADESQSELQKILNQFNPDEEN